MRVLPAVVPRTLAALLAAPVLALATSSIATVALAQQEEDREKVALGVEAPPGRN
jgi:hypothetical protein